MSAKILHFSLHNSDVKIGFSLFSPELLLPPKYHSRLIGELYIIEYKGRLTNNFFLLARSIVLLGAEWLGMWVGVSGLPELALLFPRSLAQSSSVEVLRTSTEY